MLSIENRIEPTIAGMTPLTVNPGTRYATNANRIAFITRVNSPSVRIFIGKASATIIGLINMFMIPITRVAIIAVIKPAIEMPGII